MTRSLLGLILACALCTTATAAPQARVSQGLVEGAALATGGAAFKGLPYAAPPLNALRWRSPQHPHGWIGVRRALDFGPSCPQPPFAPDPIIGPTSEDCLYLNVWTPPGPRPRGGWPVLVSIHGGGLVIGGSAGAVFDGSALAARGIVVVTFNYRLGRLGFFGLPALAAEAKDAAGINFGFMDQIAALEWVQRNIGVFGGDRRRVTIAGESAGGHSVEALMISPGARGLFSAAIAQSAPSRSPFATRAVAVRTGEAFATSWGLRADDLAGLRHLTPDTLLKDVTFFQQDKATYAGPTIDGQIIPGQLMDAFGAGRQARVPFMVGSTGLELAALPPSFAAAGLSKLAAQDRAAILSAYADGGRDPSLAPLEALSDMTFAEPARAMARLAAAAGQPVWIYRFEYVARHLRGAARGAQHASDVPYTFDTLRLTDPKASADDLSVARQIADYWVNFVKFHDPNGPSLPPWPKAGPRGEIILRLGSGAAAGADPRTSRLDLLEAIALRAGGPSPNSSAAEHPTGRIRTRREG